MSGDKITYRDFREYQSLFKLAPAFLLERFARKNKNIVMKFRPQILAHLSNLDELQRKKLDLILRTEVAELQAIMKEAYLNTKVNQYKVLSNPKYRQFIEINLRELEKLLK